MRQQTAHTFACVVSDKVRVVVWPHSVVSPLAPARGASRAGTGMVAARAATVIGLPRAVGIALASDRRLVHVVVTVAPVGCPVIVVPPLTICTR